MNRSLNRAFRLRRCRGRSRRYGERLRLRLSGDLRERHRRHLGLSLLGCLSLVGDDEAVIGGGALDGTCRVAVRATAVSVVHRGREKPNEVDGELLRALEQLRLDRIARHPEVLRLFVEPVSARKLHVPRIAFYPLVRLRFATVRLPSTNSPSGFGQSSCFNKMPSLTRHSTNLGSSSASRTICGFVLGVLSAEAASLPVFLVVGAGVVVNGQYPGPVSKPSLLATRMTSKSLMSAIAASVAPSG